MRHIPLAILLAALAGCGNESQITPVSPVASRTVALDASDHGNTAVFPKGSRPYGADMATWADRESQWIYGQPLAHNPLIDQTGADCVREQTGQVWFIPRIAGPRVFSGSRTCTVPTGKAIFLEIGAYVNEWPCPDTSFHPAPGQSMYDFLLVDARNFMDGVTQLDVSLDGQALDDVLSYRFHSAALFSLTGDPTFAALDNCVTGTPQPAIVDGFFMMFKPLTPGEHTLRVFGTDVRGANKTYLYHLNVQ